LSLLWHIFIHRFNGKKKILLQDGIPSPVPTKNPRFQENRLSALGRLPPDISKRSAAKAQKGMTGVYLVGAASSRDYLSRTVLPLHTSAAAGQNNGQSDRRRNLL
jgi:hypothetical protein